MRSRRRRSRSLSPAGGGANDFAAAAVILGAAVLEAVADEAVDEDEEAVPATITLGAGATTGRSGTDGADDAAGKALFRPPGPPPNSAFLRSAVTVGTEAVAADDEALARVPR